ncbi:BrnT family toxin [Asticcacaulis sp. AND118]|uniref:BrnT family toxin n=1 Tax=Asticcacaulis sp. AND118 TaxID=2840468 RepID=UPI001CFFCEB0|nr:BrnT family toxin [Asticcacaulis sp. AND118]UDF03821.1 BrnT family toxin [Asticcacaulis sp. AND118]
MTDTLFEWDDVKALSNLRKHGVDFDTATLVFYDPFAVTEMDRIEGGEQRWQTLGRVNDTLLLLVAHTVWDDDDTEIIRIISARQAVPKERRKYEQQNR